MENKRGQIELSFGMIFSVILIIAFVAVAIYAVMMFLNLKKCTDTGLFKEDFQQKIDMAWNSPESKTEFKMALPSSIDSVCFIDTNKKYDSEYEDVIRYGYKDANMFFWPIKNTCKDLGGFKMNHIEIANLTSISNPYCITNSKGIITISLEKGFYDSLVRIK